MASDVCGNLEVASRNSKLELDNEDVIDEDKLEEEIEGGAEVDPDVQILQQVETYISWKSSRLKTRVKEAFELLTKVFQLMAQALDVVSIPATSPQRYHFILSKAEMQNLPSMLAGSQESMDYLKLAFGVDLISCLSTQRPAVEQDANAVPASNNLILDANLATIGNQQDGELCNEAIILSKIFTHSYSTSDALHHLPFCKKLNGKYQLHQKAFLHQILSKYPNVVATEAELQDVCIRKDQFGPILHILEPRDGYACNQCDYATQSNMASTDLLHKHWNAHRKANPSLPLFRQKGATALDPRKFRLCKVQTFNTRSTSSHWLVVPPLANQPTTSVAVPQIPVGAILAAGLGCNT
ncbi:hypothetical protein F5J12DRAFT_929418 [Pisolithus orientalis]|uniref:uncharacterized protein n=1 Tax=Pisolithus orientalis TaxID=936130 RepID=UPI0022258D0B|nr:uncharacterized protein F5J12DRAFT_929418 [Pisolithus orientalis]KAI5994567.1 hypothetical protein F5J12DRAFT_929418 [Pisolithus orientalis]